MKNKKLIIAIVIFLIVGGALVYYIVYGGYGGADQPKSTISEVDSSDTTANVISSHDGFSMFSAAVQANELAAKLDEDLTIFVPNNDAFKNIPENDTLEDTLNADILNYHMVKTVLLKDELIDKQKLPTVNGQDLVVMIEDDVTYIVDAKGNKAIILTADLKTSSGVIHEIDKVLLPQ